MQSSTPSLPSSPAHTSVLVTSDEDMRGGKGVAKKAIVDTALEYPLVEHLLVSQRPGIEIPWAPRRDKWWRRTPDYCVPQVTSSEDPLFNLYVNPSPFSLFSTSNSFACRPQAPPANPKASFTPDLHGAGFAVKCNIDVHPCVHGCHRLDHRLLTSSTALNNHAGGLLVKGYDSHESLHLSPISRPRPPYILKNIPLCFGLIITMYLGLVSPSSYHLDAQI